MKVQNLLSEDMVLPRLESTSRDESLKEIVRFLKVRNRVGKEKELCEKLIQREELGSTAIKEGVAIPHCKLKGIEEPVVVLAVSRKGVEFHAPDGKRSHIIFLVVTSPHNPSQNLQILASIAHLVRKARSLQKKILEADTVGRILEVIREEEEKIHE